VDLSAAADSAGQLNAPKVVYDLHRAPCSTILRDMCFHMLVFNLGGEVYTSLMVVQEDVEYALVQKNARETHAMIVSSRQEATTILDHKQDFTNTAIPR
jgi:hypothetical protein